MVFNGYFRHPLPLRNRFVIVPPPEKLKYIILQKIKKLGKKIFLFTDDTHLL